MSTVTFISKMPWNELAFIFCSLLGGMMHYTKKFLRKETDVSMFQWFGKKNWVATIYTAIMFIFVTIGALAGGIINEQTDFWAVLYTGFVTGFAVDAGFNSDRGITEQLLVVKQETKEMFNDDKPQRQAMRNPQLNDSVALAKNNRPVEGSPNVPPKRIT